MLEKISTKILLLLAVVLLVNIISLVSAPALAEKSSLTQCSITHEIKHPEDQIPNKFSYSNNLLRSTNKLFIANGQPIIIRGKIIDSNCEPIPNAIISIWQANNTGKYSYYKNNDKNNDKNANRKKKANNRTKNYDPYFTSSGSARTDNLGRFSFITILPKTEEPYINFIINKLGSEFGEFHGRILFTPRSAIWDDSLSPILAKLENKSQNSTPMETCNFTITLPGKNRFSSNFAFVN